jgi:hypothetical protein
LVRKGLEKDLAILSFEDFHMPDDEDDYYLKKLEEL